VLYQVGAIFFEDFSGVSQEKELIFSAGIILCFFGVYLITSQRPKEDIDLAVRYGDKHNASFASVHRSAPCLRGRISCDRKQCFTPSTTNSCWPLARRTTTTTTAAVTPARPPTHSLTHHHHHARSLDLQI
jgi:hypothetical protein